MKERNRKRLVKAGILAVLLGLAGGQTSWAVMQTITSIDGQGRIDYGWTRTDQGVQVLLKNSSAYGFQNLIGPNDSSSGGSTAIGTQNEIWNSQDSTAVGKGNYVNGYWATAVGSGNKTYGLYNVAVGTENTLGSDGSQPSGAFVLGVRNTAKQSNSITLGFQNTLDGDANNSGGNAIGIKNYVSASSASAMGFMNAATGQDAFALGTGFSYTNAKGEEQVTNNGSLRNLASGHNSLAVGWANNATNSGSIAIGSAVLGTYATSGTTLANTNGRTENLQQKSTGFGSIALGVANQATATSAVAIGDSNVASAQNSLAIGGYIGTYSTGSTGTANQATAINSIAIGLSNYASSRNAVGMGTQNTATGQNSVAVGTGNEATAYGAISVGTGKLSADGGSVLTKQESKGYYSVALGGQNRANSDYSIAVGSENTVYGITSMAYGRTNIIGTSTTEANYSQAIGSGNAIYGPYSQAIGASNTVYGDTSIAYGRNNKVGTQSKQANYAQAVGYSNTVSAYNAIAYGNGNISSDAYALAVGEYNVASGLNSVAIGSGYTSSAAQIAAGAYSVAVGYKNVANSNYSQAVGASNTVYGESSMAYGRSNTIGTATAKADDSQAVGSYNEVYSKNTSAVGASNTVYGKYSLTFGRNNTVGTEDVQDKNHYGQAIGYMNTVNGYGSIAYGWSNKIKGDNVIAIGSGNKDWETEADTPLGSAILFGQSNTATGTNTLAFGGNNKTTADYTVALGLQNTVNGQKSLAVGLLNTVNTQDAYAIGENIQIGVPTNETNTVTNDAAANDTSLSGNEVAYGSGITVAVGAGQSAAIGGNNSISKAKGVALGYGSNVSAENSVALGHGSAATEANSVSVGTADATRQIVNVTYGDHKNDAAAWGQIAKLGQTISGTNKQLLANDDSVIATFKTYDPEKSTEENKDAFVTNQYITNIIADSSIVDYDPNYGTADGDHWLSTDFGNGNIEHGKDSTAYGYGAIAKGDNSVAIGNETFASGTGSVAIGETSIAKGNNEVSFGHKAGETITYIDENGDSASIYFAEEQKRKLTNVESGSATGEVATWDQVAKTGQLVSLKTTSGGDAEKTNVIRDNAGNIIATIQTGEVGKNNYGFVSGGQVWNADIARWQEVSFDTTTGDDATNVIKANDGTVLVTFKKGELTEGNTGFITGGDVYNQGVKKDQTINFGNTEEGSETQSNVIKDNAGNVLAKIEKGEVAENNTGLVAGGQVWNAIAAEGQEVSFATTEGDTATNVIKANDGTVLATFKKGELKEGDTGFITGGDVYNQGVKKDQTINFGDTTAGSDTQSNVIKDNAGNVLATIEKGEVEKGNTGLVAGGQVWNAIAAENQTITSTNNQIMANDGTTVLATIKTYDPTKDKEYNQDAFVTNQYITNVFEENNIVNYDPDAKNTDDKSGDHWLSTDFGKTFDVKGADSTAYGYGANAQGNKSVAIGAGSVATEDNTFSVGSVDNERRIVNVATGKTNTDAANVGQILKKQDVTITAKNNTAILKDNEGNEVITITVNDLGGEGGTSSVVNYSTEKKWLSTDFDQSFDKKGEGSTAYGYGANAKGDGSVAIGKDAVAEGKDSVAIGNGSVATGDNEVSFGNDTTKRKLTNVADGTANSDAATVGQIAAKNQSVSLENTTAPAEGEDDTRTNVIKDNAGNVIATFEAGEVAKDNTGFVSGGQVWSADVEKGQVVNGANNVIKDNAGNVLVTIETADSANPETGSNKYVTEQYYYETINNLVTQNSIVDYDKQYGSADGDHWLSTDFDKEFETKGKDSTAYGYGANAQGDYSVAIGSGSIATEANTFSVGSVGSERKIVNVAAGSASTDAANFGQILKANQTVTINATNNTGYLRDNNGNKLAEIVVEGLGGEGGSSTPSVVNYSTNKHWLSTDFDKSFETKGEGSTAFGYGANAKGDGSVALGQDAIAEGEGSVAIGEGSVATGENEVSFGNDTTKRKLTNVEGGTASGEVATWDQIATKDQTVSLENTTAPAEGAEDTRTNVIKDNAGNVIATFEAGSVAENNNGFVSGGQVWSKIAKEGQEISATNNTIVANDGTTLATIKIADPDKTDAENAGSLITKQYYDQSVTNIINQKTIVDFDEDYKTSEDHWLSTDFDKEGVTHGKDSTAYGYGANAQAENSVAIGAGSVATEANTFSVGGGTADTNRRIVNVADGTAVTDAATYGQILKKQDVTISAAKNTAVLKDNNGNDVITITVNDLGGEGGSSVVNSSTEKHWLSTDFDKDFDTKGEGSTAYGYGANAQGKDSVALGSGSLATGDNEVSFGHKATDIDPTTGEEYGEDLNRKLTNVAAGEGTGEAATWDQIAAAGQNVSLANTAEPAAGAEDTRTNVIKDNAGNILATFEAGEVVKDNTGFVSGGQVFDKIAAEGQEISASNNTIKANDGTVLATIKIADPTKTDAENAGSLITKQYYDQSVTNIINQKTIVDFDEDYLDNNNYWLSTDFGKTFATKGEYSTAYGYNANAQADKSVAIGYGSVATEANTFSVGGGTDETNRRIVNVANGTANTDAATYGQILAKADVTISKMNNTAVLKDNAGNDVITITVNDLGGEGGTSSVVNYSTEKKWLSTDFDQTFDKKGEGSTAYGHGANAQGDGSVALGKDAVAEGKGSVAIGEGSVAKGDNEVSFGTPDEKRKLTNVADGSASGEAATWDQIAAAGQTVSLKNTTAPAEGEDDTRTNVIKDNAGNILATFEAGEVAQDNTGFVSGGQVWNKIAAEGQEISASNNTIKANDGTTLVTIKIADPDKTDEENAGSLITKQYYDNSVTNIINQKTIVDFDEDYKTSEDHWLSTDFDKEDVTHGKDSTAYGYGANAQAENSVAIGAGSLATEANTFSVGSADSTRKIVNVAAGSASTDAATFGQILKAKQTLTISALNNSGILKDNDGNELVEIVVNGLGGAGGSSIVNYSTGSHWLSTDFDKQFESKGEASTAYGYGANAAGDGSVALGQDAIAQGTGSVAIGQGSIAKGDNEVSFGHKAGDTYTYIDENGDTQTGTYETEEKRKLTNVEAGTQSGDVATWDQIAAKDQVIDATNNKILANDGSTLVEIKVADPTKSDAENAGAFITKQYYDQTVTTIINENSIVNFDKDYATSGNHYLATDFGNTGATHGKDSTAYGFGSEAKGDNSVALGYKNTVEKESSTAVGANNTVSGTHSIAAGCDNDVQGDYAVALGHGNTVTGNNAIVIGKDGTAGKDGIVIGNNSSAKEGSTAIGNNSVATGDNEVSFGHKKGDTYVDPESGETKTYDSDLSRKLTNIADGTNSGDAVNKGQLDEVGNRVTEVENKIDNVGSRISRVEDTMDKGIAGAAALAALHPLEFDPDDKASFAVGYGHFKSSDALALGAFYRPNESVLFSLGGVFGNGEDLFNAGISFALGRDDDRKHPMGRIEMSRRIDALLQQNATLQQENAGLNERVDRLERLIQELVATNPQQPAQPIPTV